jgi:hypothetical protein
MIEPEKNGFFPFAVQREDSTVYILHASVPYEVHTTHSATKTSAMLVDNACVLADGGGTSFISVGLITYVKKHGRWCYFRDCFSGTDSR